MDFFKSAFSLAILFSLMGGLLGALLVIDHRRYGWAMTLLFVLLSMVLAAALSDYFFSPTHPWLYAGVGIFAGMAGTALLDAFKAAAPKLAGRIIDAFENRAVDVIGGRKNKDSEQ